MRPGRHLWRRRCARDFSGADDERRHIPELRVPAETNAGLGRMTSPVLGVPIDVVAWEDALARIVSWAREGESRAIYFCNVHSVVTARSDQHLREAFSSGDLLCPDGSPVAWTLRRTGSARQPRISGPDLMGRLIDRAEAGGLGVYFYGDTPATLDRLREVLLDEHPNLRIAGLYSPPFRDLTPQEDREVIDSIHASGAALVFVALGCPKQEKWIAAHRGKIEAPMLGVGAAIAFRAGVTRRAPAWMQRNGLEWLHRLASEPRRLLRRYFVTNSIFVALALRALATQRLRWLGTGSPRPSSP